MKLPQKPHRHLVLMEHLFLSFAFKSASASQTQTNSPCAHPFVSAPLETSANVCRRNQAWCWHRSDLVHHQHWEFCGWGRAGLQRSVSAGCTTGRTQPLSHQTSASEASSLLTIYFGSSFRLFNVSNYNRCWEQINKVQEEFSVFCFVLPGQRLGQFGFLVSWILDGCWISGVLNIITIFVPEMNFGTNPSQRHPKCLLSTSQRRLSLRWSCSPTVMTTSSKVCLRSVPAIRTARMWCKWQHELGFVCVCVCAHVCDDLLCARWEDKLWEVLSALICCIKVFFFSQEDEDLSSEESSIEITFSFFHWIFLQNEKKPFLLKLEACFHSFCSDFSAGLLSTRLLLKHLLGRGRSS